MTPLFNFVKVFRLCLMVAGFAFLLSCSRQTSKEAKTAFESIIPKPVSANLTGKSFYLTKETAILIEGDGKDLTAIGDYLSGQLKPATGFDLEVSYANTSSPNSIFLTTRGGDVQWGAEGYELTISEDQVKLAANEPAGLFYGVQSLRQLFSEKMEASTVQKGEWEIATGTIRDYPEYEWRGSMLDVARHFFSVEDVKKYIDYISFYKMNMLHLHLSDDQGWRIEIKSRPNLTATGGSIEVGGGKGGFYTQEQYKDIVAYAQSRFTTIIPEIDLPGHINAALVSYPELNSGPSIKIEPGAPVRPVAGQVYTGIEVGFSTLHINKPETFKFVDDVLRELAEITPGPYLHIGGDEAHVTKKPDYMEFINRFKVMVEGKGKKMIGWGETAQAKIDSNAVVQFWDSEEYAKLAAEKGAKLIFSPAKKVYLDMQYDSTTKLGLHWAAYIEVDSSYMWDPANYVDGIERNQILGVEAPLWTETIVNMDDIEYMIFPRLAGIAEIGWTAPASRSWDDYKIRLGNQSKRWKTMGIDFYHSPKVPWVD